MGAGVGVHVNACVHVCMCVSVSVCPHLYDWSMLLVMNGPVFDDV